ncbi:MAG: CHAD domain-containing protein [Pseudorhodobacter sp.]|nr:CHAD domain-containing protein [Pseudorhodobacter sp.]
MTAEEAARRVLSGCVADFDRHLAQIMVSDDPEAPHAARVALRRLRSALSGFAPILDQKILAATKSEARALFRLLGPVRDADVLAHELCSADEVAERMAQASARRFEARAALVTQDGLGFAGKIQALCAGDRWWRSGSKAEKYRTSPARRLAARALDRAWRAGENHAATIPKMSDADRHEFRKDMKTLRYMGDFFGPLWPGKALKRFLERMEVLQGALGTLNDIATANKAGKLRGKARAKAEKRAAVAMRRADKTWHRLHKAGPWWH